MIPPSPEIAVVVSTHNRAGQLAELLEGLRAQTLARERFEVVVVDDASSDATADLLAAAANDGELAMKTIGRERSGGAAIGREQGWRASAAQLIAFTDDDCVPDPRWLEEAVRAAAAEPGSILQGRTEPRPDQLHRSGPFSRTIDVAERSPHFQTTNIVYPRAVLERLQGFDTASYAGAVGGEDTDLAWRAIEVGIEVRFDPSLLVFHAVNELGAIGKLRVAARSTAVLPFARHPELRRESFVLGVFRKPVHMWLTLAAAGLALPGRLRLAGTIASLPYLLSLRARGRIEGGGLALAPYYLVHDLVEIWATLRGAIRTRRVMI